MDKYNSRKNVFIKVTKNYFKLVKHTTIKNQAYIHILFSVLSTVVSSNDKEKSNYLFILFSIK